MTITVHTRKAVQQLKSLGQVAQFANEKLDANLPDEFILNKVREIGLTYAETQQQSSNIDKKVESHKQTTTVIVNCVWALNEFRTQKK